MYMRHRTLSKVIFLRKNRRKWGGKGGKKVCCFEKRKNIYFYSFFVFFCYLEKHQKIAFFFPEGENRYDNYFCLKSRKTGKKVVN